MRSLSISVIFLTFSLRILGQIDYLTPCLDLGAIIPDIKAYESDFYKVILKGFNDKPIARYIVQPSWGYEYAFQIQQSTGENYILIANYLRTNLWNCNKIDTINPEQNVNNIEQELVIAFSNLFKKVLLPVDMPYYGLGQDGITYRLSTYDKEKGLICGETWSPDKGSKMFALISICEATLEYSKSPSEKAKNDLIKQMNNLLTMLN